MTRTSIKLKMLKNALLKGFLGFFDCSFQKRSFFSFDSTFFLRNRNVFPFNSSRFLFKRSRYFSRSNRFVSNRNFYFRRRSRYCPDSNDFSFQSSQSTTQSSHGDVNGRAQLLLRHDVWAAEHRRPTESRNEKIIPAVFCSSSKHMR
jgi:hypothetical protein